MSNSYRSTYEGFLVCNYSAIAALTFTLYDFCLTSGQEVHEIWRRPWTKLKALYIFIRGWSLLSQIVSNAWYLSIGSGALPSTGQHCKYLIGFQGVASQIAALCVQVILILRIRALYGRVRLLTWGLLVLFAFEQVSMAIFLALGIPRMEVDSLCTIVRFPNLSAGTLIPPIIFELILFILGMCSFYRSYQKSETEKNVLNRLHQDGIWAFAIPCSCLITNTFCFLFINGSLSGLAYSWVVPLSSFAGYRLILNMSHLLKINDVHTGPVLIDTNIELTRNMVTGDFELDEYTSTTSAS